MNIGETPAVQVPKEFLAVILAGVGDEYVQPSGNSIHIQLTLRQFIPDRWRISRRAVSEGIITDCE